MRKLQCVGFTSKRRRCRRDVAVPGAHCGQCIGSPKGSGNTDNRVEAATAAQAAIHASMFPSSQTAAARQDRPPARVDPLAEQTQSDPFDRPPPRDRPPARVDPLAEQTQSDPFDRPPPRDRPPARVDPLAEQTQSDPFGRPPPRDRPPARVDPLNEPATSGTDLRRRAGVRNVPRNEMTEAEQKRFDKECDRQSRRTRRARRIAAARAKFR